jgi:hypothetical protein
MKRLGKMYCLLIAVAGLSSCSSGGDKSAFRGVGKMLNERHEVRQRMAEQKEEEEVDASPSSLFRAR